MAKDLSDVGDALGAAVGTIAREVAGSVSSNGHGPGDGDGSLSGMKGIAAGAALAAVPMAGIAAKRLVMRRVGSGGGDGAGAVKKLVEGAKGSVTEGVSDAVSDKVDQVGGAPEMAKEVGKKMLPGMPSIGGKGGDSQKDSGTSGVGKGRRMPVQQAVDVAVPLSVAYNQWTQFEEWPQFMHRIDRVTQEDDCTVSLRAKVWGMSKESVAEIVEQKPDERIKWNVTEGAAHSGVVTFHELAPNLTRVQVSLDFEPGSWIEKAARGMRHLKRAVRADLARFKAFIEMEEEETGAWRGVIHDGEVVKGKERQGNDANREAKTGRAKTKAAKAKAGKAKAGVGKAKAGVGKAKAGVGKAKAKVGKAKSHAGRRRAGSGSSSKGKRSRR